MNKEPYLVAMWTAILKFLEKISVFYIVRNYILPNYTTRNYRFVDNWLVFHTLLSILFVVISYMDSVSIGIKYILVGYGSLRIFEIFIYQLNVLLVHPYQTTSYTLHSYRRMTIALIHNFFEIVFWFAGTYITFQFINGIDPGYAVYHSFTHMVTYSLDIDSKQWPLLALIVLQGQALVGVFMTVISLARFISLFPQPQSTDSNEQHVDGFEYSELKKDLDEIKEHLKNQ